MPQRFEGRFRSFDQTEIFFQVWRGDVCRGTMVVTHGLAEHSDCYAPLANQLCQEGWTVYGWDMRGHGRSEGKRGFAMGHEEFASDFRSFIEFLMNDSEVSERPLLSFSHSMGAQVVLRSLLTWPEAPFKALCLSSPLIGIAIPVPVIKDKISRLAFRWLPTLTLHNEIKYSDLTRDETMIRSYEHDPLRHDKISPGLYLGMVDSIERILQNAEKIHWPVLMQLAGHDRIVSTPAAQTLFDRLPNKKNVIHVYPDSLHEIYNDLDRDEAFSDMKKFINNYLGDA